MTDIALIQFVWRDLINPEFYIQFGGLWWVLFIVFAETGLFVGFFLPGDALLFVAGIYSSSLLVQANVATGNEWSNLLLLIALVMFAAIVGNMLAYFFGKRSGIFLYQRPDTFFFKKKHVHRATVFYQTYGVRAVIIARFIPIIRTFAPIVAGTAKMPYRSFMACNVIGAALWSSSMIAGGHYLYQLFMNSYHIDLKKYIEVIVIGIVVVSTLPVIYKLLTHKK